MPQTLDGIRSDSQTIIPAASWTTLHDDVRIDDNPTSANSATLDVSRYTGVWLLIDIDSTLAPTTLQVIIQFSHDAGTTWWDFEEGLFASLFWEDTDTAAGINKTFLVPCAGHDDMRVRIVGVGTDATNYFDVTICARPFYGVYGMAHA